MHIYIDPPPGSRPPPPYTCSPCSRRNELNELFERNTACRASRERGIFSGSADAFSVTLSVRITLSASPNHSLIVGWVWLEMAVLWRVCGAFPHLFVYFRHILVHLRHFWV